MRRRIEALAERLDEFVSEDAHDALVVECVGEAASGVVGAAADLLAQRGACDVFVPSLGAWTSPDAFADELIAWIGAFCADAELAPPPSAAGKADARLARAVLHLARATGALGDVRLVLLAVPSEIRDPHAYVETLVALVRSTASVRTQVRLVLREPSEERVLRVALSAACARVLDVRVDCSLGALRDAMAEEAADPTNDPDVRASALLTAALGDAANGRAREALPVLAMLAEVFRVRGDASSRALCFVLIGNALAALGQLAEARDRVAQGLAIAVEARAFGVLVGGAMLGGQLSMRIGDAADADQRFDVVARLGAKLGAPLVVTEALSARGEALEKRGLLREALDAWLCAAAAARRAGSEVHERSALARVAERYRDAGLWEELAPIERRLDVLACAPSGCAHDHAQGQTHGHAS